MEFRLVQPRSEEYDATLALRNEVLRHPLGLQLDPQEMVGEEESLHVAGWQENVLVACVVLKPISAGVLRLRQCAVRPNQQGQGIGRALVQVAEQYVRDQGGREIVLHARESAVGFYEKLGYAVEGESFEEVTLPHVAMRKRWDV